MRDKRTILYLLIISTFLLSMLALLASAETGISTSAKSSSLYNSDTGTFVYGKNMDMRLPMASTTKIMTALIAIERLDPEEMISVPKEAVGIEGSSLYLSEGDVLRAKDLIYSLMLQSANDAAVVLALRIGNTIPSFAEIMNEKAREIGTENTSFENPHGLDSENHYTTAHDLALISAAALKNETFKKIVSTYKYSFKIGEKTRTVVNHNKLLKLYDGCIGIKTGYTKKCGRCLVSAAEKDGVTLIAVTLSAPDDWKDHSALLDYGFEKFESVNNYSLANIPDTIPVISGDKPEIKIGFAENNGYTVKYKTDELGVDIQLIPYVTTDINEGDIVGKLIVRAEGYAKETEIIALEGVKIKNIKKRFF